MLVKMETGASGGGNGYDFDVSKLTNMECVSAWNPGSSTATQYITFSDIPYTDNVLYVIMAQNYASGSYTVGAKYPYVNHSNNGIVVIDNGTETSVGTYNYSVNGTQLKGDVATRYSNYGLFVMDNK